MHKYTDERKLFWQYFVFLLVGLAAGLAILKEHRVFVLVYATTSFLFALCALSLTRRYLPRSAKAFLWIPAFILLSLGISIAFGVGIQTFFLTFILCGFESLAAGCLLPNLFPPRQDDDKCIGNASAHPHFAPPSPATDSRTIGDKGMNSLKRKLSPWIGFWVCLALFVSSSIYLDVLSLPMQTRLQRLDAIQTEYKELTKEIELISQQKAEIEAEIDHETSWSKTLTMMGRSFFDGMTFGAFEKDGFYSVTDKYDQWLKDVSTRDARRIERAKQIIAEMESLEKEDAQVRPLALRDIQHYRWTTIARSWSLIIGLGFLVAGIVHNVRNRTRQQAHDAAPTI